MATALSYTTTTTTTTTTTGLYYQLHCRLPLSSSSLFSALPPTFPMPYHPYPPISILFAPPGTARCLAVTPGPPSPSNHDPPPPLPGHTTKLAGLVRAVSRIQEHVKIFLAVQFWMSLFFWASSSNEKGKGKRKKKSSRFRKF